MPDTVLEPPPHTVPAAFTRALLDWLPWLEPLAVEELTERHRAALVDAARAKSPYFRLLARDPDALRARTLTDKDIFYNADAGLPRAERELAAAATSRFNGCIYCASVHARHAATYSKREADVQRLLDDGINRRSRRTLERDRRRRRGAEHNADNVRIGAYRAPASRRAGRSGDRRRDPSGIIFQLGQPLDAVARRAGGGGRNIAPELPAADPSIMQDDHPDTAFRGGEIEARLLSPGALSAIRIAAPCRWATAATRLRPRPLPALCRLRSSR